MAEKTLKGRIVQKHDLEVNWLLATNFVPKQGEIIIYDIEIDAEGNTLELPDGRTTPYSYERVKIGDGITLVSDLPFYNDGFVSYNEQALTDEQKQQARENISRYDWHYGEGCYNTFDVALADTTIDWDSLVAVDDATGYYAGTPAIYILVGAALQFANAVSNYQFWMSSYISKEIDAIFTGVSMPSSLFKVYVKQPYHEDINYVFTFGQHNTEQNYMTFNEALCGTTGTIRYNKTTDSIVVNTLKSTMVQTNLTSVGYPVESKTVGDALAIKADQTALDELSTLVGDTAVSEQITTAITNSVADWSQTDESAPDYIKNKPDENDAMELVAEMGLVSPIAADDGSVYTDENGVLYTL